MTSNDLLWKGKYDFKYFKCRGGGYLSHFEKK
jgi:hypothetical protein